LKDNPKVWKQNMEKGLSLSFESVIFIGKRRKEKGVLFLVHIVFLCM
jgi:hypothetical protein